MTPEEMAEALENARYAQLRGDGWAQLRESERQTRTAVGLQALENAGILTYVAKLQSDAAIAPELHGYIAQRDAEISRRRREHEEDLARLRAEAETHAARRQQEHEDEVARVRAQADADAARRQQEHEEQLGALRLEHASQVARLETQLGDVCTDLIATQDDSQSQRVKIARLTDQLTAARAELDQALAHGREQEVRADVAEERADAAQPVGATADAEDLTELTGLAVTVDEVDEPDSSPSRVPAPRSGTARPLVS